MKVSIEVAKMVKDVGLSYDPRNKPYEAVSAALDMDRTSPAWGELGRALLSDVLIVHYICKSGIEAGGEELFEEFKQMNLISLSLRFADEDVSRAAHTALRILRNTGYQIESIHQPIYDATVEQPALVNYMKILGVVYPGYEEYFQDEELYQIDKKAVARTMQDLPTMVNRAIKTESDEGEEAEQDTRAAGV